MSQVIVVGGGLSGLSAAHTLLERGANVLVLDKNSFFGGNSTKATSGINGANTRAQNKLGIKDTSQAFFEDTKKSARDLARDDLITVLTHKSGDAVNWLTDKFNLDLSKVTRLGGHSFERTHRGNAQFPGMTITFAQMEALEDFAKENPERVKIIKKAKATELIKDGENVIGVEYVHDGKTLKAYGPVILATGGYAADFAEDGLLNKHRPELMKLPTTNGDHCTGDGQKMAMKAGANGIDLEKVQVHPTGLVDPKDPDSKVKFLAAEALRGVGGLLLDNEGNRFCDELGHRDYVTGKMWENNKFPIRLILNGQASAEIEWHCKHYVGRGLMKKFENGRDLAKEMGISESKLAKTFADYQAIAYKQKQDPFGKKFFHNSEWSLNSGPFNVALMTPVLHYTMGGLEIDESSRVLGSNKKPVPGLFASGEIAGGVHGANRLGGSSLLGCVVFGRVAGDSAAAYLLQNVYNKRAEDRLNQIGNHLGAPSTTIKVIPGSNGLTLEFDWSSKGNNNNSIISSQTQGFVHSQQENKAKSAEIVKKTDEPKKLGEYSLEEVAKHNTEKDCWVVVEGKVLDVTNFLPDHPGGAKAILLYAGKDATEEFLMLHDPTVVAKYAPETVIGTLKK